MPTTVYRCSDGFEFIAQIQDDVAWGFLPEGTIGLERTTSPSGERYVDDTTSFWTLRNEAKLETATESRTGCLAENRKERLDRRRS
jgi:membrane-bound inhibitor of C-type lysozyme